MNVLTDSLNCGTGRARADMRGQASFPAIVQTNTCSDAGSMHVSRYM